MPDARESEPDRAEVQRVFPRPHRLLVHGLTVERGGRTVLAGLDLELEAGRSLIVTGANGVGKSTLLRAIAGLVPSVAGTIALEGGDPELPVAAHCHYAGHLDAVKPALTVAEWLRFWADYYGPGRLAPEAALHAFDMAHLIDLPAGYLSAGQRRRLSLARLLVSERPLWLLDEPTAALDAASEARLVRIIADHLGSGGMAVAATHAPLDLPGATTLSLGD